MQDIILWAFFFIPLIYVFIFMPVSYCLNYYSFAVEIENMKCGASSFVFA